MAVSIYNENQVAGVSQSINIGVAGNNRLIVISMTDESTPGATFQGNVTVDGKLCKQKLVVDNNGALGSHLEMFTIDENALGNSNGVVTIAYDAGDAGWGIGVIVYYGVKNDTEIDSGTDNTFGTTVTIPNIDTNNGGLVVMCANNANSATAFSAPTSPQSIIIDGTDPSGPTGARGGIISGIEVAGQTNKSYSLTGGNARFIAGVLTFDPADIVVTNVTSPKANATYVTDAEMYISSEFSEQVDVNGIPKLNLDVKSGGREIEYIPVWTPEKGDCQAWYDASDLDTITEVAGLVSQLDDKSPNGLDLTQGTGSLQPQTDVGQVNGLNTLLFDQDRMQSASNPFGATVTDAMVLLVMKTPASIATAGTAFSLTGSDTAANRWQCHIPWTTGLLIFDAGGTGGGARVSGSSLTTDELAMIGMYNSNTDGVQVLRKNGASVASDASALAVTTVGNLFLGAASTTSVMQNMIFCEMIILNSTVSSALREKYEGYLAWKWGLQGSLGGGHTYKNRPPLMWNPHHVNAQMWLDAGDEQTIIASSNLVSQWNDKSRYCRNVYQTVGANQPESGLVTVNGLNAMNFIAADPNYLQTLYPPVWLNAKEYTVFAVTKQDIAGAGYFIGTNQNVTDKGLHIGWKSAATFSDAHYNDDFDLAYAQSLSTLLATVKYKKPGSEVWINGTSIGSSGTLPANDLNTDQLLNIGTGWRLTTEVMDGLICELLILTGTVTTAEKEFAEGYLAWKWGLQASLISTHTYKKSAPTV